MGNGLFTASSAGANFGDYYVSANGTGTLMSANGLVNITDVLHDTTTPDGYIVGSDGAWVKDGQVVVENVESTETNK